MSCRHNVPIIWKTNPFFTAIIEPIEAISSSKLLLPIWKPIYGKNFNRLLCNCHSQRRFLLRICFYLFAIFIQSNSKQIIQFGNYAFKKPACFFFSVLISHLKIAQVLTTLRKKMWKPCRSSKCFILFAHNTAMRLGCQGMVIRKRCTWYLRVTRVPCTKEKTENQKIITFSELTTI